VRIPPPSRRLIDMEPVSIMVVNLNSKYYYCDKFDMFFVSTKEPFYCSHVALNCKVID